MITVIRCITLLTIVITFTVNAQTDTVGWGPNSRYNRMYNPKTVTEIEGKIIEVQSITPLSGMSSSGVHLLVDSKGTKYSVHVGPKWYLKDQPVKLNELDIIKVTGSKVNIGNEEVIIAQMITKGKETLKLRNDAGIPNWSMGKRRKPR